MKTILGPFADFALGALCALLTIIAVLIYLLLYGWHPKDHDGPTKPKRK